MKGVIVNYSEYLGSMNAQEQEGMSIFSKLYSSIMDRISDYYWVGSESMFSSSHAKSDDEFEYFYNVLTDGDELLWGPRDLFPKNARWINDDGIFLCGFRSKPSDDIVDGLFEGRISCESTNADCVLFNEDNVYWEIYSSDNELLNAVVDAFESESNLLRYWKTDLSGRAEFYQKGPSVES